jgi:sigma-B regulation protein RsbU (phosphoserine phosphatase)
MSTLFAEVVGFTALISARVIFPLFSKLPYAVRLVLQVVTLFSGTLFGSAAILWAQPLFSLARLRTVIMIVLVNAALAVVVGIALHTYDAMRRQIEASYETLRQKEALERELSIAREVQRELLPHTVPKVPGLELAGACIPAVGVGGDYYDFLPLDEDRIALVIADVSGKGIPAALLMAGLQASVRSLALHTTPPCEVNHRLNEMLLRSTSDSRYATLFYATYDRTSRILTYSNAGHFPPLLMTGDRATQLSVGGRPVGILEGSDYGEGVKELRVGDLIALFTDGIIEAPNRAGEEFGEERLTRVLKDRRGEPLEQVIGAALDELVRWSEGTPRHDDLTLVLARVV